MISVKK